jgi:hypothetical protein
MHIDKSVKPAQIINNLRVTHGLHISYQNAYITKQKVMNEDICSIFQRHKRLVHSWNTSEIEFMSANSWSVVITFSTSTPA